MTYEELFTFENLYNSHLKARLCKRYKKEVIEFELNTGSNIMKLFNELKYQKYKISSYKTFYISDPKERRVDALSYRDRIVQHCLCDYYLTPLFERKLIFDNAATRPNKGTDFARGRLKHFYNDFYNKHHSNLGYILKCDIYHYFESIDHSVLKEILKKDVLDHKILHLLYTIIDSFNIDLGKGLPIGNQTSQAFAIRYLDELDRVIKEKFRIKYYIRYMDDFILIDESKEKLIQVLKYINDITLPKYKLTLNRKTKLCKLSFPCEFLGFRYHMKESGKILMIIDGKRRHRFLKKINNKRVMLVKKQISLNKFLETQNSYIEHISKRNKYYYLKKIKEII